MTTALRFAAFIDAMTRLISQVAAALLLGLVGLIFFNVVGRYVFGNAPVWMQELEWHLLVPIAMLGIVVLMLEKGHVRVDMLYEKMSPKLRQYVDFISMMLGAIMAVLLIKYSYGFVENSVSLFERSPDPGGLPGRWVLKGFLPIAFALLALQCAANAVRALDAIRKEV